MKKIVFLQYTLNGGGAEKVLINLLNKINYKKYEVTLVLINKTGMYLEEVNRNVKIKYFYNPYKFKIKLFQRVYHRLIFLFYDNFINIFYRLKIGNRYDIEVAFLEGETTRILNKSTNKNSKKIGWIHTDLSKSSVLKYDAKRENYDNIDEVICVSNDVKLIFNKVYSQFSNKVEVLYNFLDSERIKELSKESTDIKIHENTIIGIGRLINIKRFDLLIKAHRLLLDDNVYNEILIIGEGEEKVKLIRMIESLKVEKTVKLLGFQSNPYKYLRRSKVFALCSDFEGFPLALAEALILEKAVISTRCTGAKEILSNGEFGVMINTNNPLELKDAMKNLIVNDNMVRYFENKAKERKNIFDESIFMKKFYKEVKG